MDGEKVTRKGFRSIKQRWDIFPFNCRDSGENAVGEVSIFCSDFPERISAKELFNLFDCVGKYVEVVISPRRDKWGKRFGFGRFKEEGGVRMLAVRLDSIQLDGLKIHSNFPRFERNKEVFIGERRVFQNVQAPGKRFYLT